MPDSGATGGRENQRRRARKDLLQAAARLLRQGRTPSLEEVAEEALVSRATAYRYFPGVDALLVEAAVDVAFPELDTLFDGAATDDVVARLERVDAAVHEMIAGNEAALRLMLAHALQRSAKDNGEDGLPIRQNRRTPLIEAALAPARQELGATNFDRLVKALALVIGTETMVVFKDVLQLDDTDAAEVRRWMIRSLVEAARKQGS